jgi:hypothetical protein
MHATSVIATANGRLALLREGNELRCAGVRFASGVAGDGDIGSGRGELEVAAAGAVDDVGVVEGIGVRLVGVGCVGQPHAVERDLGAVVVVVAVEEDVAAA